MHLYEMNDENVGRLKRLVNSDAVEFIVQDPGIRVVNVTTQDLHNGSRLTDQGGFSCQGSVGIPARRNGGAGWIITGHGTVNESSPVYHNGKSLGLITKKHYGGIADAAFVSGGGSGYNYRQTKRFLNASGDLYDIVQPTSLV